MEMQALFTLARQALIKHIHQPGFAAPNAAPHIQAAYGGRFRRRFAFAKQLAEFRPQPAARRRCGYRFFLQFTIDGIEAADRFLLHVVGLMAALFES